MKKKSSIIITSIIIVIIFISCFHNGNSAARISYENMPSEIKDSIESIITHIKIDKIPTLICFRKLGHGYYVGSLQITRLIENIDCQQLLLHL